MWHPVNETVNCNWMLYKGYTTWMESSRVLKASHHVDAERIERDPKVALFVHHPVSISPKEHYIFDSLSVTDLRLHHLHSPKCKQCSSYVSFFTNWALSKPSNLSARLMYVIMKCLPLIHWKCISHSSQQDYA